MSFMLLNVDSLRHLHALSVKHVLLFTCFSKLLRELLVCLVECVFLSFKLTVEILELIKFALDLCKFRLIALKHTAFFHCCIRLVI